MPCFLGLAVSIHTPDGPIAEYSIQRQSKYRRITTYIPVPPPKTPPGAVKPEQSTFAISITLLTPGISVPYSTPKPTKDDPYPRPKVVGGMPGESRQKYAGAIGPYIPMTSSPNETIAAYIYFDGRPKEEVATLLRRGEETWVNSRWVSVAESDGGGLAEREFLFREVGLERWLNGLDLQGTDKEVAAKIEKRRQKMEKRRLKQEEIDSDSDSNEFKKAQRHRNGVLRYGDDQSAPVENLSAEDSMSEDSDSDDEPPSAEAAGQIKVALYRVLASGEIKRGEYSPQFDAHDDDDLENGPRDDAGADIDHTTSFAKPKTLDPKTISTQTVTGIDPPDKPYAVFTFLYRGQRQLQKMGIVSTPNTPKTPVAKKRASGSVDFSSLKPLKSGSGSAAKNFAGYRDAETGKNSILNRASSKRTENEDEMDSDADDEGEEVQPKRPELEEEDEPRNNSLLSPEDANRQDRLAEGVKKINLKRQASAEPLLPETHSPLINKSPSPISNEGNSPVAESHETSTAPFVPAKSAAVSDIQLDASISSPFKRARAETADEGISIDVSGAKKASELFSSSLFQSSEAPKDVPTSDKTVAEPPTIVKDEMQEEEL